VPPLEQAQKEAEQNDPQAFENYLATELKAEPERGRKAVLQHELGHHYLDTMDNESGAVRAFAMALKLDPHLRPNVWAIRRIFVAHQLWPNLLKLLDAQSKFEEDPARLSEVLLEKGWILQDYMDDPAGAKDCLWESHAANMQWLVPLLALEKLALAQGDFDCLADVYRQMSEVAVDPERKVAMLVDLARLQEQLTDGTPHQALAILEDAFEIGIKQYTVLCEMQQVASSARLTNELTEILRRQAEFLLEQEEPSSAAAAGKLRQAAKLARGQLDEPGEANRLLAAALEAVPDSRLLQHDMLDLAEEREDWALVEQILTGQIEAAADDVERAALQYRLGMARARAGSEEAASALESASQILPGYLPVLLDKELEILTGGDLARLADLYEVEAGAAEHGSDALGLDKHPNPEWSAVATWRAGSLAHRRLQDHERAIVLCRRALELQPKFQPALRELEELYEVTGQYDELARLLEEQLDDNDKNKTVLLLEELTALAAGVLDAPERELGYLRMLRDLIPTDLRIMRAVVHVLHRLGRFDELEDALRTLETMEQDASLLGSLKMTRASLYEGPLKRPADAISTYREILARFPGHSFAFASLEHLLEQESKHEELAQILRRAADESVDAAQKTRLLRRLGTVYSRHLGDPAKAVDVAVELLHLNPDDLSAIRDLTRAAQAANDVPRVAMAMEAQLEKTPDPEARARLLIRLSSLLEDQLSDADRAEDMLAKAISLAPVKSVVVDALDATARRQMQRREHNEATGTLQALEEEVSEETLPRILEERAWITAGPMEEVDQGQLLWQEVLQHQPEHAPALWGLQRIHARNRDAQKLSDSARSLGNLTSDPRLASALCMRAAVLADAAGVDDEQVAQIYRQVLEGEPNSTVALAGLLARPEIEPPEYADLLARLADQAPEQMREQMRLSLALAHERAGRFEEAGAELSAILEGDGDNLAALVLMQRLARTLGDREQESRAFVRIAQISADAGAIADAYTSAAGLQEGLARPQDAAVLYRQVLAPRPEDDHAYARLRELYQVAEDWEAFDGLLGHRVHHTEDDQARLELYFERALHRLEKLQDKARGALDLLRVLEIDGAHLRSLILLAELYDGDDNIKAALKYYARFVEGADSADSKRASVLRMAELLHDKEGRTGEAIAVCNRFLDQSSDEEQVLERVGELYIQDGDFPHAVQALERLGALRDDRHWQARNLQRVGRIHWKEIGQLEDAHATLIRSRDLDPLNVEVIEDLVHLCEERRKDDELDQLLTQAKEDIRAALSAEPLSIELYKKLMKVAEWHQDQYTLMATLGVLSFFNVASADEDKLYRDRVASRGFEPKGKHDPATWHAANLDRVTRAGHGQIWAVIVEGMPKLFPGKFAKNVSAFGVSKSDKVDRKAGGPVTSRFERIAGALGISDYDIYLSSAKSDMLAGVALNPPALVIGHSLVTSMDGTQRYHLGRTLSLMSNKAFALEVLTHDELSILFTGALANVERDNDFGMAKKQLKVESKRVWKSLARKTRKLLPDAVARFRKDGGDLQAWIEDILGTADRVGLLVSGDIISVLEQQIDTLRSRATMDTGQIVDVVKNFSQAERLLVYSVSGEYLNLRSALGV